MLFEIISGLLIGAIVVAALKIMQMKPVDRQALVVEFQLRSGLANLLAKLDVRPIAQEVTLSNGVKTIFMHHSASLANEAVREFEMRHDDVIIATYPKSGTTWTQEIVWLLCNNADIETAKRIPIPKRYGFLEFLGWDTPYGPGIQGLRNWPEEKRRFMKTHMQYELLPEAAPSKQVGKIIYVARNPKDVCVSYYHFHRACKLFPKPGSWDEFLAKLCSDKLSWGSWFSHNITYWKEHSKNKDQIYFVTYEDLKENLREQLEPLAKFLERDLTSQQLDAIAEHCSFENMSKNETTNFQNLTKYGVDFKVSKFLRKGQVGDWKNYFTLNQNEAFDKLYDERMKGSGLALRFELRHNKPNC